MGACIEIVWLEGRHPQVHTAPYARVLSYFAMGKHLTADELDSVQAWRSQGISTLEIHCRLQHARATGGGDGPNLSAVRRALRGVTHRRGMVETRGRKRTLSPANIRALNTAPPCALVVERAPSEWRFWRRHDLWSHLPLGWNRCVFELLHRPPM